MCGAEVPPLARACPECGADDTTGWNEDRALYDGLDLPDDEFHYDEYRNKEFGVAQQTKKQNKSAWFWLCIIGAALVLLVLSLVLTTSP